MWGVGGLFVLLFVSLFVSLSVCVLCCGCCLFCWGFLVVLFVVFLLLFFCGVLFCCSYCFVGFVFTLASSLGVVFFLPRFFFGGLLPTNEW